MDFLSKIVSGNINRIKQNISNSFVQDLDIQKGFDDELEKGKWSIGDTKVYQGITWEVGGFNAKGAPLWRKAKGGAGSGASSSQNNVASSTSQNNTTSASSSKTSNTPQPAKQNSSTKSTNSKDFDYYLKKYGDGNDSQEAIANWRTWWIGLELKGGAKTIGKAKYDLLMDFLYKNNDKEYVLALTNALLDSFSDEQKKGKMLKKKYEHIKWLRDNTDVRVDYRLKRMSKK